MQIESGYWSPGVLRPLAPHHNAGLELVLVEQGQASWQVDGQNTWVAPGSIFFTMPWQRHGDSDERQHGLELYYIVIPLDKNYRKAVRHWSFAPDLDLNFSQAEFAFCRKQINACQQPTWLATPALRQAMRRAHQENIATDLLSRVALRAAIENLLVQFIRSAQVTPVQATDDFGQRVHYFLEQLPSSCHQSWSLEAMAASCGLGRTQFSNHVKRITGFSPKQWLNRLRVERAKSLLKFSSDPIISIALDCGFESSQYFARVFKAIVGMDATSYRKRH